MRTFLDSLTKAQQTDCKQRIEERNPKALETQAERKRPWDERKMRPQPRYIGKPDEEGMMSWKDIYRTNWGASYFQCVRRNPLFRELEQKMRSKGNPLTFAPIYNKDR